MNVFLAKIYNSIVTGNFLSTTERWLFYKKKLIQYRIAFHLGFFHKNHILPSEWINIKSSLSILPGDRHFIFNLFNENRADENRRIIFNSILDHKIKVLSSEPYDVSAFAKKLPLEFYSLVKSLPKEKVSKYRPINWNCDFKTGKEWPTGKIFFDKVYNPQNGSDVKIPWELSRFVHIGSLIHGSYEEAAIEFMLQTSDWIVSNPRFTGINWSSELIVSIRVINFIWGISFFYEILEKHPIILNRILVSIYDHRLYLEKNMAFYTDSTDDHYLGNIVALTYISMLLPNLPKSDEWLVFSFQQLCSEMERQVLDDGFSYMMSSGYHRFVAELFASATSYLERIPKERFAQLSKVKNLSIKPDPDSMIKNGVKFHFNDNTKNLFPNWYYDKLFLMGNVINALTKPNGKTVQFGDNDSARPHKLFPSVNDESIQHKSTLFLISSLCKIEMPKDNIIDYYTHIESQIVSSGLNLYFEKKSESFFDFKERILLFEKAQVGLFSNDLYYMFMSCSPNGYNGLGGHGHNDKCSFELNVKGRDFFVDGGCPYYTSDIVLRNAYRSVKAHNTFLVDDIEQDPINESEVFLLRQARTKPVIKLLSSSQVFSSHDGFGVTCSRKYTLLKSQIKIEDYVPLKAESKKINFNLHPDVNIVSVSKIDLDYVAVLKNSETSLQLIVKNAESWTQGKGYYGTGYGEPVDTLSLEFGFTNDCIETLINF
jgi:hypothetical protein